MHCADCVKRDVYHHFYCAVNDAEQRGIAIATSKPMGRSQAVSYTHLKQETLVIGNQTAVGAFGFLYADFLFIRFQLFPEKVHKLSLIHILSVAYHL